MVARNSSFKRFACSACARRLFAFEQTFEGLLGALALGDVGRDRENTWLAADLNDLGRHERRANLAQPRAIDRFQIMETALLFEHLPPLLAVFVGDHQIQFRGGAAQHLVP